MALIVVERVFAEPIALDEVQATSSENAWCYRLYKVRFVRSYVSTDGRHMICLYEAPDVESVRRVQKQTGLPAQRIWAASLHEPMEQSTDEPADGISEEVT